MIDWDDFRLFLAIAREHTLSGAARRLQIDQSTVSRRLAAMEEAAGARLFDRMPEGYVPSSAAEAVLGPIEEIEARAIAVERVLVGQDTRVEGRVRVATSDSLASWFVVPNLGGLKSLYPDLLIELVTGNYPVSLARREADLSLRLTKPTQPNLVARRLGRAAWALYASSDYVHERGLPDKRRRLSGHDVVLFDEELAGTAGARWLRENASESRPVLISNSLISALAAVVAGLGVGALPTVAGDVEPSLRRVSRGIIGYHDIWMVVHPDVKNSARVRAVIDYLTALVKREEALLAGRKRAARAKR